MDGWIKLHRKILSSKVWRGADADGKVILLNLLLRACHVKTSWALPGDKVAVLKPGELFISYRNFAVSCGVTVKKLRNEMERLKSLEFITVTCKKEGTVARINNWQVYQQQDEGTPLGTPLGTPQNAEPERADTDKSAAPGTPLGTQKGTHNKNYILLKNKLNKTGSSLLAEIKASTEFNAAIAEYKKAFPANSNGLKAEYLDVLAAYAAQTKPDWLVKAVKELKAINKMRKVRYPASYLFGILINWLNDGLPNDRLGAQNTLEDFYREAGVIE